MQRPILKVLAMTGLFLAAALVAVLGTGRVRLSWSGHEEGVFLLRGVGGAWLELRDDVYLGEEGRVLAGWSFDRSRPYSADPDNPEVFLEYRWNEAEGYGYIVNHLGGGRLLLTNFARYLDSDNRITHGLFVGGGRPESLRLDSPWQGSDTGMAYFDGRSWTHIWCNTNEVIGLGAATFAPSSWRYLGSRVELQDERQLVVVSRHGLNAQHLALEIERRAVFVAGQPYFDLSISLHNRSPWPGNYFYFYGDEPWVGRYGSSAGDVGWVDGRLVGYEEKLDPRRYSYAGMADLGSRAIGEAAQSRTANFLEWRGPNLPDQVFIANHYTGFHHPPTTRVPLTGDTRSIGLYWGPKQIQPGERQVMSLAVGMADFDPTSGYPRKPQAKRFDSRPSVSRGPDPVKIF